MSSQNPTPAPPKIVLASGSPRRRDLLARLVPAFNVLSSPVEEQGDTRLPEWGRDTIALPDPFLVQPESDPRLWAWRKAVDVAEQHQAKLSDGTLVLGADTIVVAPGSILGKPGTVGDARDMLYLLRGRAHYVVTGFVLLRVEREATVTLHHEAVTSQVVMRPFDEAEVEDYLATGESMDKAGAYALQGIGGRLVERVDGCRTTVIGLPVCRVRATLVAAGAALLEYPQEGYCPLCARQG
ncbi:MAG TPA: Maf family protein [Chloroflexia bacterium]|jgi:septum formation protein|nr:Maf family protein [Chloroflexia bacterium]